MLLAKLVIFGLRLHLYVLLTKMQKWKAEWECRVDLRKPSFQLGSMVYTERWQQV
jgi:hypothetical protein